MAELDILLEAERRGILPPDKKGLLDEARKRGLVPALEEEGLPQRLLRSLDDAVRSIAQGATLGFADEIAAGASALTGIGGERGDFAGNLAAQRVRDEAIPAVTAIPAELAGAVGTGTGLSRAGLSLLNTARPTLGSLLTRGAAEGTAFGSAIGAGKAEGGLRERARGALEGGATGAATGALAGALTRPFVRATQPAPSTEQLRKVAGKTFDDAFDAAEAAGVRLPQAGFTKAADDIAADLVEEGFNPRLHPRIATALDEMGGFVGGTPTLQQAENLRRVIKNAGSSIDASERRLSNIMVGKLDDFVENLPGAGQLKEARALWKQLRRGETIDELINRARTRAPNFSVSGFENALRTEFRQLALNVKKMRGFSKAEQAAIRKVAEGGSVENALRLLGKLAPTGVISTAFSGGMGFALGGPVGAVALPAAGLASRGAATALTSRNARLASELARQGGQLQPAALSPLAQQLIRGGAIAGPVGVN